MTLYNMKFKQVSENSFKATNTAGGMLQIDYQCDGFYITYSTSGLDADLDEYEESFDTFQ